MVDPKQDKSNVVSLLDGTQVLLRRFEDEDVEALLRFYRGLPEEDRLFLKDDVTNRKILNELVESIHNGLTIMVVAIHNSRIVGEAALHVFLHGWTKHVGELRAVVLREYSAKGLMRALIREQIDVAIARGLDKIVFRILDTQKDVKKALEEVGFVQEAVLRRHAIDLAGNKHDIIIMSNFVVDLWRKMEDLIRDMEFKETP